jgi:hypothetical protein
MNVARLWSGVVDGAPTLDDSLERTDDRTPRAEILAFLNGGTEVMRAAGRAEDWLAPGHPAMVPIGFRTDGTWLWSEELAYYLREHDVLPEPAFLSHMSQHHYVAQPAPDAAVREAEELLGGPS